MRVTSEFWVSALCRKVAAEGAFAYVAQRGAKEAGAIFILINDMAGATKLLAPAPQSWFVEDQTKYRLFESIIENADDQAIQDRLDRERRFDPDIWIVEIEDREGRTFVDLAKSDTG